MAENTVKKVDYKKMSNQKCPDCGHPLKQNKVIRNHHFCYHCFKLRIGQRFFFKKGIKIDRLSIQRDNRKKYHFGLI